jgi:dihydrolipoamide dehydrogenase
MNHLNNVRSHQSADVIVIGGGPAGYVAAIRAAQLGGRVALVEEEHLGGTCLNHGCIPTKVLLKATGFAILSQKAAQMGVELKLAGVDLEKMMLCKQQVIDNLKGGINGLLHKRNVELIRGSGRLVDAHTVEVQTEDGLITRQAKKVILASGSKARPFKMENEIFDYALTSKEALQLKKVPKSVLIIGAGAIGIEFAFIFRNLGAEVTIVEMMPQLLPQMDAEIVANLEEILLKKGIKLFKNARVLQMNQKDGIVSAQILDGDREFESKVEQILAATGRIPATDGLFEEKLGIKTERGIILVNSSQETTCKGVFAAGDATGGTLLAHVASFEGKVAAENAMGQKSFMDYKVVPSCIYSSPEMASVGMTEKQAREKGLDVRVGRFPMAFNGKALTEGSMDGMVKVVADAHLGEILGVHILGDRATDLIAEAALAMKLEATVEELMDTIHAHPTLAETMMEAAADVWGKAIHLP